MSVMVDFLLTHLRASNSVRLFISESALVYIQFNFVGMCMCARCWFDGCLLFGNVGWLLSPPKGMLHYSVVAYNDVIFSSCSSSF